jgi:hypothetical protein
LVGIVEDEGNGLSYVISLLESLAVTSCWKTNIEPMGEFVDSFQFCSGDAVRVDGKGKPVD